MAPSAVPGRQCFDCNHKLLVSLNNRFAEQILVNKPQRRYLGLRGLTTATFPLLAGAGGSFTSTSTMDAIKAEQVDSKFMSLLHAAAEELALQSATRHIRHRRMLPGYEVDSTDDSSESIQVTRATAKSDALNQDFQPHRMTLRRQPVPGHCWAESSEALATVAASLRRGALASEQPAGKDELLIQEEEERPLIALPIHKGRSFHEKDENLKTPIPDKSPSDNLLISNTFAMVDFGSIKETRIVRRARLILQYLYKSQAQGSESKTESIIRREFRDSPDTSKALRMLVAAKKVQRCGKGGRQNPFLYKIPAPTMQELKASSPNTTGLVSEIVGPVNAPGPASQASPLQTPNKSKRTGQTLQEPMPGPDKTPISVLKEQTTRRALAARKGPPAELDFALTDHNLDRREKRLCLGSSRKSPRKGPPARLRKENVPPEHVLAPITLLSGTQQMKLGTPCASPEAAEEFPTLPLGQHPLQPNNVDEPKSSLNPASGGSSNGHHSALTGSNAGGTATASEGRLPFAIRNTPLNLTLPPNNMALPPKMHRSGAWSGALPAGQKYSSVTSATHQAGGSQSVLPLTGDQMPVFYLPVPAWPIAQGIAAGGQLPYAALPLYHQPAQNLQSHWAANGPLEDNARPTDPIEHGRRNEESHKQSRLTVMDYTPA